MAKTSNTEEFINKARKIHEDKYDYSKVDYKNNRIKVCIICAVHGEFWQSPTQHLNGQGCPECGRIRRNIKNRLSQEEFIKRANDIHNNKYDYSKVEYKNTDTKVCIICPIHGEFLQTPHHHLKGIGCPQCGSNRYSTEEFIKKAKNIHGDKYDYSKVKYKNKYNRIIIICPKHGEFLQLPQNHLQGRGCPECGRKFGKQEKIILEELNKNFNNVIYQYSNNTFLKGNKKNLTLDFYFPDYNIGIEYQGIQHFKSQEVFGGEKALKIIQERDLRKYHKCLQNNIKLYYISFEKEIPEKYFEKIYTNINDLIKDIKEYAENKKNIK